MHGILFVEGKVFRSEFPQGLGVETGEAQGISTVCVGVDFSVGIHALRSLIILVYHPVERRAADIFDSPRIAVSAYVPDAPYRRNLVPVGLRKGSLR